MKHEKLLKSIMGSELFDQLHKALTKLSTSSVVDIGEVYHSLNVAPKAVISFLSAELRDMDDAKEVKLPWADDAILLINKQAKDVYSGYIKEKGKITHEFNITSMPALAAHLTSHFELYEKEDDAPEKDDSPPKDDGVIERVARLEEKVSEMQLKTLESKVNELIALSSKRKKHSNSLAQSEGLEKAGIMPTMPGPPKPGSTPGGSKAVAHTGFKGNKTVATDRMSKPIASIVKPPSAAPAKPKTLTFNKSDMSSNCLECGNSEFDKSGNYSGCSCWRGMSKPTVKKAENDKVTLEFGQDWDNDALVALIRSIKKYE